MKTGILHRIGQAEAPQAQAATGTGRMKRWLAAGVGVLLLAVAARATLIVEHPGPVAPETEGLTGGASAPIWSGMYSGPVDRISISFLFDPNTEVSQQHSWASDLALIIIAPGMTPRQWGGADGSPLHYPGATRVGDWNSPLMDSSAAGPYSDVLTDGMAGLEGSGTWQVVIMNAADIPGDDRRVYYSELRIVLEGPGEVDPPAVHDRGQPWECLLTMAITLGMLVFVRRRTSAT